MTLLQASINPDCFERVVQKLGGVDEVVREFIGCLRLFCSAEAMDSRLPRPKGIIVTGKPGTGKTALASCVAEQSGLPYTVINCPDIFQSDEGASENRLRSPFFSAQQRHEVSLVILEEIDVLASLSSRQTSVEARIFSMLISIVDGLNTDPSVGQVFVIGTTNRLHAVDPSLIRSGRLDRIFELIIKSPAQRLQILNILTQKLPFASDARVSVLDEVSRVTHGFVATDLQYLCVQVAMMLVAEEGARGAEEQQSPAIVTADHFRRALMVVRPSNLNEFQTKTPTVRFSDLFGIDDIIEEVKTSVIRPFHHPLDFIRLGIAPPRGVLVYGPPGVGKTTLCCAVAAEAGINFLLVESSQLRSKIVGESERNVARAFAAARASAPCILFIDQIDILVPRRGTSSTSENTGDRIVTGFLTEMDGFLSQTSARGNPQVGVLVVAATSRPNVIDPAILRPGRLDEHVWVPPPNVKQRIQILQGLSSRMPITLLPEEIEQLAAETHGYSGADLDNLCREAGLISIRESVENDKITSSHIAAARSTCKPSLVGYEAVHPY